MSTLLPTVQVSVELHHNQDEWNDYHLKQKTYVFNGKKECLGFLNPVSFPLWPHNSCAGTSEQPFKAILPAHCWTCATPAVCVAAQTATGPQNDCCGEVSGLDFGLICRCYSAVSQPDVLRQGPVLQAAPGQSMPALQATALRPPDLSWARVLRRYWTAVHGLCFTHTALFIFRVDKGTRGQKASQLFPHLFEVLD